MSVSSDGIDVDERLVGATDWFLIVSTSPRTRRVLRFFFFAPNQRRLRRLRPEPWGPCRAYRSSTRAKASPWPPPTRLVVALISPSSQFGLYQQKKSNYLRPDHPSSDISHFVRKQPDLGRISACPVSISNESAIKRKPITRIEYYISRNLILVNLQGGWCRYIPDWIPPSQLIWADATLDDGRKPHEISCSLSPFGWLKRKM